jgi:hypothetical protein
MNVNITGIYDNTVIVDSNLFDDVRLLQTGFISLSDTLFSVVGGLLYQYANLTSFSILSNDHKQFKITSNSYLSILNNDVENLTTNLSILNTDISNNFVNNTLSTLTTAVDDQFVLTTTYIDEKITEQHEYTDQEIEALRTEGCIQEAVTQLLGWATSDEGKRFRKTLWTILQGKWLSLTGRQAYTELLDDAQQSTSDQTCIDMGPTVGCCCCCCCCCCCGGGRCRCRCCCGCGGGCCCHCCCCCCCCCYCHHY